MSAADSAGVSTRTVLERCPVCGYRLSGLPACHRCPECGWVYDSETRVWFARGFGRFAGWMTLCCLFGMAAAGFGLIAGRPAVWARVLLWIMMLFCGAMTMGNLMLFRRRPFVALTPQGILIREHWFTVRTIPWEQLGAIEREVNLGAGALAISDVHGRRLTTLGTWFSRDDCAEFIREAQGRQSAGTRPADT